MRSPECEVEGEEIGQSSVPEANSSDTLVQLWDRQGKQAILQHFCWGNESHHRWAKTCCISWCSKSPMVLPQVESMQRSHVAVNGLTSPDSQNILIGDDSLGLVSKCQTMNTSNYSSQQRRTFLATNFSFNRTMHMYITWRLSSSNQFFSRREWYNDLTIR